MLIKCLVVSSGNFAAGFFLFHSVFMDSKSHYPVVYGELIVLGYNGSLTNGERGRRRSKYLLHRRSFPNGIKKSIQYVVREPQSSRSIQDKSQHSISYTLNRNQAVIVEYQPDKDKDMFQIGRSSESQIDFVVIDTVIGDPNKAADKSPIQSTISRFACRILIDRDAPYTARIYAAGFDSSRNIFLGEKASKWENDNGELDGLTTNGILIMQPKNFCQNSIPSNSERSGPGGVWREVSVNGEMYSIRETRSSAKRGVRIDSESNVLYDGTLIDLCGATLLWRTVEGLAKSPTKKHLEEKIDELNAARPQCPVGLNTLVIPRKSTSLSESEKQPYVYLNCGHVQGLHDWGQNKHGKTCPMCLKVGPVVKLSMGIEPSLYLDNAQPIFAFNPCGHMCTEQTARYWSQVTIPHGTNGFHSMCPFCATQLQNDAFVRLIFQDHVD